MVIKAQSTSRMNKITSAIECLDEFRRKEDIFIRSWYKYFQFTDYATPMVSAL